MACYNIASIIYLPCGVYAVHRSWMTEFSVAMHNYSGVNHVAWFHGCLNLKCDSPGDIISTQVIDRVSVHEQSNHWLYWLRNHLENYVRYGQAPFALHWLTLQQRNVQLQHKYTGVKLYCSMHTLWVSLLSWSKLTHWHAIRWVWNVVRDAGMYIAIVYISPMAMCHNQSYLWWLRNGWHNVEAYRRLILCFYKH